MTANDYQQQNLLGTTTPRSRSFAIVFDGGSLGNPGKGYGSYEIVSGGEVLRLGREEYTGSITNNQAEYMTLIQALKWLLGELGDEARSATVDIRGDSQLVIYQITGKWKVKNARMIPLVEETKIAWHPRAESVKKLGH